MSIQPHLAIFLRSLAAGGAERVMVNLANHFAEDGLSVDLVLTRMDGAYHREVSPKVRLVDLNSPKLPKSLPGLVRYLRCRKPPVLLSALHYACEIALWARFLARTPTRVVVSEHNTLSVEAKSLPQRTARLTPLAARLFYPWSDAIVAVSQGVAEDLAVVTGLPVEQIQTIYNPVIIPDLDIRSKEPLNHPWFQPGSPPVILGVGRLVAQKDFATLIRAFQRIRQDQAVRLMILGEGQQRPELEHLIQTLGISADVALAGFVANPYAFMARAAVFALSSVWEGFGNVLVEAMATGTPVVATDCPSGPAEILANGQYGHLVPVGDDRSLATAIVRILEGDAQRADSNWLNQFKIDSVAQQYRAVLQI
jgi:glycosyltransferase involved in cell wall biosynthesis